MFNAKKDPIATVLFELIKLMNWKITYGSLEQRLVQHPNYPFLFSITNTLENFGITNKAVRIASEQLEQLSTPFLATTNQEETVLVKSIINGSVGYYHPIKGYQKSSITAFEKFWNHMVILIDTSLSVGEQQYQKKRNRERLAGAKVPILFSLVTLVLLSLGYSIGFNTGLMLMLSKLSGLTVTLLLVNKEINKGVEYKFCKAGKKINCNDVLDSPAAKIFSWLSMTDLGLLYFTSTFLALVVSVLVVSEVSQNIVLYLIILSFLTIPYTLFSLFYQAFIIKKWCSLCISIIFTLWVEAILGYFLFTHSDYVLHLNGEAFLLLAFSIFIPATIWLFVKDILIKSSNYTPLLKSYFRITNNIEVFQLLQQKGKSFEMDILEKEILLGNINAPNTLVIAMNPFCPACGREYTSILELLDKNPDFIKVIIRFVGSPFKKDDANFFAVTLLINLFLISKNNFKEILREWFDTKNPNSFAKKYVVEQNEITNIILRNGYLWSEKVKITITPTVFFNNIKLTEPYSVGSLNKILEMKIK